MLKIKEQLLKDIASYCKVNEISDPDKFCTDMLERAFMVVKYGKAPDLVVKKDVEVQVPIDVIIEAKPIIIEEPIIKIKKENNDDDYEIYDRI